MATNPPLSDRGDRLISASPMPLYIEEHFERVADADPNDPDRYIGLCIAQNLLMWDLLEQQLNRNRHVKPRCVAYDSMIGSLALREQIASFASEHIWGRKVDADHVIALAGGGSILESLFYTICDPGHGVLIPTPSYAGFWADLETRDQLRVVPVHTSSEDDFRLTTALLEEAYTSSSVPISAIMLTNPDNPMGRIISSADLQAMVEWARRRGLHIVINEVYALTVHGNRPFEPASPFIDGIGNDVHQVWAISKDFSMSGLRCGVMTSKNVDVLKAVGELAYWSVVSGDTQHLVAEMLADTIWITEYLTEMRARLGRSYRATTDALDAAGIAYLEADAGMFVLADLRAFLDELTWEAEDRLWRQILEDANVNLTPGSACHIGEPGFMRICFATEPPEVVARAIGRLASVIN
ncbi:MAG: aminotransferase class I/II-fold pyridoxal phosphate-dependent enzyme [Acidimicrobiia bacterium]